MQVHGISKLVSTNYLPLDLHSKAVVANEKLEHSRASGRHGEFGGLPYLRGGETEGRITDDERIVSDGSVGRSDGRPAPDDGMIPSAFRVGN